MKTRHSMLFWAIKGLDRWCWKYRPKQSGFAHAIANAGTCWGWAAEAASPQLVPSFATAIDNTESCSPRWHLLLTFSWDYSWALLRPPCYQLPQVLPMHCPWVCYNSLPLRCSGDFCCNCCPRRELLSQVELLPPQVKYSATSDEITCVYFHLWLRQAYITHSVSFKNRPQWTFRMVQQWVWIISICHIDYRYDFLGCAPSSFELTVACESCN